MAYWGTHILVEMAKFEYVVHIEETREKNRRSKIKI